jgi:hypothetical protein
VGSKNGEFSTPKGSGCKVENLREWWVGEKISCSNVVGKGIFDRSSAIAKTMRIQVTSFGEANSNSIWSWCSRHAREFLWCQKNLRLRSMRISVNSQIEDRRLRES